jgi:hypothetical protein
MLACSCSRRVSAGDRLGRSLALWHNTRRARARPGCDVHCRHPLSPLYVDTRHPSARSVWRVADLYNLRAYADLIRRAGFTVKAVEDLTADWGVILKRRLAMYGKLREEAQAAGTPAGHDAFYKSYVRFVDLVRLGAAVILPRPKQLRPNIIRGSSGRARGPTTP